MQTLPLYAIVSTDGSIAVSIDRYSIPKPTERITSSCLASSKEYLDEICKDLNAGQYWSDEEFSDTSLTFKVVEFVYTLKDTIEL
jgi:hypothetical protein